MDLTINDNEKLCYLDNEPLSLTKSEYKLVSLFINNKNKIFSREELIKEIWKDNVGNRAVDTAVSRLRKKLGDYSKCIVSRNGFGYGYFIE